STEGGAFCGGQVMGGDILSWVLVTVVQVVVGKRFFVKAIKAASHGSFGMDLLVVMGTSVSYLYSTMAMVLACTLDSFEPHLFLDSPAMLLTFITFGKYLEAVVRGTTSQALVSLLQSQPQRALLVLEPGEGAGETGSGAEADRGEEERGGRCGGGWDGVGGGVCGENPFPTNLAQGCWKQEREIDIGLVQMGDLLKVLPGSRFPTDGVVVSGSTVADESMITGESAEVLKEEGDPVCGGTVNCDGMVLIRATRVGSDTALAQVRFQCVYVC
ncbi:unnamed protein product, partial [Discosporangium mesarthrocarpum]